MNVRTLKSGLIVVLAAVVALGSVSVALAEVKEVRIAKQYGLGYLPLIILEDQRLIEKHAKASGLGDIKITWATVGGGGASNDALLSGSVDYISTGVAPLVLLWGKSNGEVKGVSALFDSPLTLNTSNPAVKSIRDLTEKDRIALPTAKVSIQAILLQIAAAKEFGADQFGKLDSLTVSMKHPDALAALLSGGSEITAHLTGPPFTYQELRDPRVHKILDSYELLGGPHTFLVLTSTQRFQKENPQTFAAVFTALQEAIAFIKADQGRAADIYLRLTGSKEGRESILEQLKDPTLRYGTTPHRIGVFADFMHKTGAIKVQPGSWKELFFPIVANTQGS